MRPITKLMCDEFPSGFVLVGLKYVRITSKGTPSICHDQIQVTDWLKFNLVQLSTQVQWPRVMYIELKNGCRNLCSNVLT